MQVTERSAAAKTEGVAHERSAVERWLRWSGLVPLPAFLLLHLGRELSLSTAMDVSEVVRAAPSVFALITAGLLVWLPLVAHAALGVWHITSGRRLLHEAEDVPPQALLLSRACSLVALAFLVYHARQYPLAVLIGEVDARDAGFRLVAELSGTSFGVPARASLYVLGLAATTVHSGLSVHRALLREGLLNTAERRALSARACAVAAAALFCVGVAAVIRVASGVLLG